MTHRLVLFSIVSLSILSLFINPVFAGDSESIYNQINLSISASDEIENDTLVAQLYAQKEGQIASQLAAQVNQTIEWAIQQTKQIPSITVQTLDYHTRPLYRKQVQDGWRVKQSLRLTSQDTVAISQLIGKLQQRLMVESIRYQISHKRRVNAENRLITQAINAFKARAKLISKTWEHANYRLVKMDIHTSGRAAQPRFRAQASMEVNTLSTPALETGKQTIQATASGTIELL